MPTTTLPLPTAAGSSQPSRSGGAGVKTAAPESTPTSQRPTHRQRTDAEDAMEVEPPPQ